MAREMELKYGLNPDQKPARIFMERGELPIEVLGGQPGYINFLDALNGWQLVRDMQRATGLPAAASFKHVSPAGAAIGLPLTETLQKALFVEGMELTPQACAYARARGADRMSSFGDFIALSEVCDTATARLISREVSDGVIAPRFTDGALKILAKKKQGKYNVIKIDPDYTPDPLERKQVFGVTFEQKRSELLIDEKLLDNVVTHEKFIPDDAVRDLILSLIVLKYTQSNSVCYVQDGQAIGVGAGQQSRIHCTRLAGDKADLWHLRQHPKALALQFIETQSRSERDNVIDLYLSKEDSGDVLGEDVWRNFFTVRPEPLTIEERTAYLAGITGVSLGSDAFFPFGDNVERAARSGVSYIAQPGGSARDDLVIDVCDRLGIAMAFTGVRLFHH